MKANNYTALNRADRFTPSIVERGWKKYFQNTSQDSNQKTENSKNTPVSM